MRKFALGLVALTFASTAALAQTPITFAQIDLDGDGRISFTELQAIWPDITEAEFNGADVEGLGSLTPEQLNTLQPASVGAGAGVGTTTGSPETLGTGATDGTQAVQPGNGEPDFSIGDPSDTDEISNADDAPIAPDRSLLDSSDDN